MKKIVPFKRDLTFKTNLSEITSISLEHTLHLTKDNLVTGDFILTGEYKIADNSTNTENFKFELPFDINIDDKYITDNIFVDIDDFYYEIVDSKVLSINIEVLIDKLEEKPLIKEIIEQPEMTLDLERQEKEEKNNMEKCEEERCIEEEFPFKEIDEAVPLAKEVEENVPASRDESSKSIFDSFSSEVENYSTYRVYIVRENDTIDTIVQKYGISKEELEMYNDLSEIKIGDKLILPSINAKV